MAWQYFFDLILFLFWFVVLLFYVYIKANKEPKQLKIIFICSFYIKIIGGIFHFVYHKFVYGGGDTFVYHTVAKDVQNLFWKYPLDVILSLFLKPENYSKTINYYISHIYYYKPEESLTIKFAVLPGILGFGSYFVMNLFLSFFCFLGLWNLFKVFVDRYDNLNKQLSYGILFIPTVVFWASGISKEAIVMGAFGHVVYYSYKWFILGKFNIIYVPYYIFCLYCIAIIKGYILVAFLPALFVWYFLEIRGKIKNKLIRNISTPLIVTFLIGILYIFFNALGSSKLFQEYATEETINRVVIYYEYLSQEGYAGSRYDIGKIEPNLSSIISTIPRAINVTIFRPYIWEVHNLSALIASIESSFILIFTIIILFKKGIKNILFIIFSDPFLISSLIFVLIFGAAVGLTSGNFGTLVRYKMPCMPFFVSLLIITYYQKNKKNTLSST